MSATTETSTSESQQNTGTIEEIQGVVIEAVFPDKLPEINHAITVERPESAPVHRISRQAQFGWDAVGEGLVSLRVTLPEAFSHFPNALLLVRGAGLGNILEQDPRWPASALVVQVEAKLVR